MTKSQGPQSQEPILILKQSDTLIEFYGHPGPVVSGRRSCDGAIEERVFSSLGEGVRHLGRLTLDQVYAEDPVEATLASNAGVERSDLLSMLQAANADFSPSRLYALLKDDPPLVLNGHSYYALPLDDGSWAWFEEAAQYSVIARASFCEWASRVSGLYEFTVGRMASGHVVIHEVPDDQRERVTVIRRAMSDVDAVLHWFSCVSWEEAVREVFEAVYRAGKLVLTESDLRPDGSPTLEILHELNLGPDEIDKLWSRYDAGPQRGASRPASG